MRMFFYIATGVVALLVVGSGGWILVVNNVEQPDYEVVRQDGPIQVRRYPALVVAEVKRMGARREAVSAGFRPLASYIFAKDRAGPAISMTAPVTQEREKIAMTAPVTQVRAEEGASKSWNVNFIMPSEYKLEDLPRPAKKDVTLRELPASRRAAIKFSGVATDELIAEKETQLIRWVSENGFKAVGNPIYAYYNDPFTPGPLRRNEVMLYLAENESRLY
jgi:hypothetical protein